MAALLEKYLGADWLDRHDDPAVADRVLQIPDEELWAARQSLRAFLFNFIRERARTRWTIEGGSGAAHRRRRHDVRHQHADDRLRAPVHRIQAARADLPRPRSAGAHPQRAGPRRAARLRRQGASGRRRRQASPAAIYRRALDPKFGGRIGFVDDYDLHVAHFLVQGCDVWMNNPRKPLEASGTSGMKAAINGTPHMSIGDGWWAEGFTGDNGWLIEGQADPNDHGAQDWADAQAIYALLENQLVPAFYDRDANGLPRRWLRIVKQSIRTVLPRFSARRMVKEYVRSMYLPAAGGNVAVGRGARRLLVAGIRALYPRQARVRRPGLTSCVPRGHPVPSKLRADCPFRRSLHFRRPIALLFVLVALVSMQNRASLAAARRTSQRPRGRRACAQPADLRPAARARSKRVQRARPRALDRPAAESVVHRRRALAWQAHAASRPARDVGAPRFATCRNRTAWQRSAASASSHDSRCRRWRRRSSRAPSTASGSSRKCSSTSGSTTSTSSPARGARREFLPGLRARGDPAARLGQLPRPARRHRQEPGDALLSGQLAERGSQGGRTASERSNRRRARRRARARRTTCRRNSSRRRDATASTRTTRVS